MRYQHRSCFFFVHLLVEARHALYAVLLLLKSQLCLNTIEIVWSMDPVNPLLKTVQKIHYLRLFTNRQGLQKILIKILNISNLNSMIPSSAPVE